MSYNYNSNILHTFTSSSQNMSFDFAKRFAATLLGGETIFINGPLGAGKTTFAKGIAAALKLDPASITSPSFSIVNTHINSNGLSLIHVDLFRINSSEEVFDLDIIQLHDLSFITIIEWGKPFYHLFAFEKTKFIINISVSSQSHRTFSIFKG